MIQCLTMTSLKTKNICFLAAFLFLSIVPTLAEVVDTVQDCNQFLYQGTPPNIPGILVNGNIQNQNRYRVICQTFNDEPRYLTVYDTVNKIPVFSAYEYRGRQGPDVNRPTWMIEPQLDEKPTQNNINMRLGGHGTYNHQAVNADYDGNNQGYDKGHLFSVNHASTPDNQTSTFTLTNAVPQDLTFNRGRWKTMEQCMKCIMNYYTKRYHMNCFVVVGAHPGNNNLNNRVNIPSMMWSAFYCNNHISGAYWSNNDAVDLLHEGTLQDLRNTRWGIDPFPGAA